MTSQARALLDSLMGPNRNAIKSNTSSQQIRSDSWTDSSNCAAWLLDLCPHDLLVNTRVDLGKCPKRHAPSALSQFKQEKGATLPRRLVRQCEETLRSQIARCDRRIERQTERLVQARPDKNKEISDLLRRAELLVDAGETAEAMRLMAQAQEISVQIKRETVCETCGAIVPGEGRPSVLRETHLQGRQHQAFLRIRQWLDQRETVLQDEDSDISNISV